MTVFERNEVEFCEISTPYWVRVPVTGCEIVLDGERMKEVKGFSLKFKYLAIELSKHGEVEVLGLKKVGVLQEHFQGS